MINLQLIIKVKWSTSQKRNARSKPKFWRWSAKSTASEIIWLIANLYLQLLNVIKLYNFLDLIALRSCPVLPEDPNQHLIDYFGNQRSPLWDQMETMTDENQTMAEALPAMQQ